MNIVIYILAVILTVYTAKQAYRIWKFENNRLGGFVVGMITLLYPFLAYWIIQH